MGRGGYWGGSTFLHIFTRKDTKATLVPGVFLRPASASKKLRVPYRRSVVFSGSL